MALASCCCEIVWAHKLAIELGFSQLKLTDVYEDNTGCIALASNMHLRGRSKHIALRVCFIQKPIQDRIQKVTEAMPHRGANCRHKVKGSVSCLAYLLKTSRINFLATSTLVTIFFSFGPSQAACVSLSVFNWFVLVVCFIYMSLSCFVSSISLDDL